MAFHKHFENLPRSSYPPYPYISQQLAKYLLGKNREEFQANTTFSKRNIEKFEANLYQMKDGIIIFVPTNLECVSFLDLEQHFHMFPSTTFFFPSLLFTGYRYLSFFHFPFRTADRFQMIKDAERSILIDHIDTSDMEKVTKSIRKKYYALVRYTMDVEFFNHMYESIKANWDISKLKRFIKYCLNQDSLPGKHKHCEMIVDLLAAHNVNDSAFVISVFSAICEHYITTDESVFISRLPSNLIQFYVKHLKSIVTEIGDIFAVKWFYREELLIDAIMDEDLEKIKQLVLWKFPSGLLPSVVTPYVAQFVKNTWPRVKDDVELQSYYSLEYFSIFSTFLLLCADLACHTFPLGTLGLSRAFQIFWRAVPTPYLPFADISACVHKLQGAYPYHMKFDSTVLDEKLWNLKDMLSKVEEYHDVYAPRSLQHLCRCAVREMYSTPKSIELLLVPQHLKPYLRLEK